LTGHLFDRGSGEETACLFVCDKERFDFREQVGITGASFGKEAGTVAVGRFESCILDPIDLLPPLLRHGMSALGLRNRVLHIASLRN
jgi:hypothetical protein